jgi:hypothetical protein
VEQIEKAISFDRETCRWSVIGDATEVQRSEQRSRVLVVLKDADEGLSTSEILSRAHLASRGAADVLLSSMAGDGQIERVKKGVYGLPGTTAKIAKIAKIAKKDQEYGENPAKHHTPAHTPASNASKAQGEATHTPDPPGHSSAFEFLMWALTPGRRLVRDIEASAREEGLLGEHQRVDNAKSFQTAKGVLGVVVEREGFGPGSKVYWRLPGSQADGNPVPQAPEREPEAHSPEFGSEPKGDGQ